MKKQEELETSKEGDFSEEEQALLANLERLDSSVLYKLLKYRDPELNTASYKSKTAIPPNPKVDILLKGREAVITFPSSQRHIVFSW